MKRLTKYLLTLCAGLIAVICIAACGGCHTPSSSNELVQLEMPTNLKADFWELTWEKVEGASGYTVCVLDEEYQTEETEFVLFDYLSPNRKYDLAVKALGDNENYSNSEWATITYHTEKVTENLTPYLIQNKMSDWYVGLDGTYEITIMPNAIPADGRLVLPDYLNGIPVTSYNFPNEINANLFQYSKLKRIRFPNTLKVIRGGLQNSSLKEAYIPKGVEYVGGFADCKKLTKVFLPDTVIQVNNFAGCSALKNIDLPNSLKIIAGFRDTGLTEIKLPSGLEKILAKTFENTALTEITLPNGLKEIGDRAFAGTQISELIIPKSVTYVGADILADSAWAWEYAQAQYEGFLYLDDVLYGYRGEASNITVLKKSDFHDNVRLIAASAFIGFSSLQSVVLPGSLQELGASAFAGCTALSDVSLPNGILSIGSSAFSGCTALEEISLPDSILELGGYVFENCTQLSQVNIPKNLTVIAGGEFWKTALTSIVVPTGVKEIQSSVFFGCSNLESVVLPDTLEKLGESVFYNCGKLSQINLPDGLTEIQPSTFASCTSLKKIEFPERLVKIGNKTFENSGLEEIALPASVREIGFSAFVGTKLASIVLPKALETLGYAVFGNCANLKSIVVSSECSGLELVDFYKATALKKFYYTGTQEQWAEKGLTLGNVERLYKDVAMFFYGARSEESVREEIEAWEENLTVYFYSEVKPTGLGNFWHYENGVPVAWV